MQWFPRTKAHRDNSPYDLDGGERTIRPKTGRDIFPYPPLIGAVSGFMKMQDIAVWGGMFKRLPFGPGATSLPLNLQYQITVPGLTKQGR